MSERLSVTELWRSAPAGDLPGPPVDPATLPEPAQRYLSHAIALDARPVRAVRARMEGQIKINNWLPFKAEQVIDWGRGFIWQASVKMMGLPIRGSDRLLDGQGGMSWKILGLIPIVTARGPHISRSAAGRLAAESVWLPAVLRSPDVSWSSTDAGHPKATLEVAGELVELTLTIDGDGRLEEIWLPRWGNPDGGRFGYASFGAIVQDERTFDGYTVPTTLRVGWYFGEDRFESDGEFFRVTITEAEYK